MTHARSQHPNAVLTPTVGAGWSPACSSRAGRSRRPRSGSRSTPRPCASGATGSSPKATPALLDRSSRPHRSPEPHRRERAAAGDRGCAASAAGVPTTSPTSSAWPPRRCSRSCAPPGLGRLDRGDRATGREPVAPLPTRPTRRAGPRRRQEDRRASHPVAAGGSTAAATHRHGNAPESATGSSTPPSMTAPASPTPRSTTTNKPPPPPGSGTGPHGWFAAHGHHHRASPHRQRRPATGPRPWRSRLHGDRHHPQTHPPLPTPDQRQSRTLPPHPARGMGLHPPTGPATAERPAAYDGFIHFYNHHRSHGALGLGHTHRHPQPASPRTTSPAGTPRPRPPSAQRPAPPAPSPPRGPARAARRRRSWLAASAVK